MSMGFDENKARKATMFAVTDDLEESVNWLMEHQEDDDIDEPAPTDSEVSEAQGKATTSEIAQSYKVPLTTLPNLLFCFSNCIFFCLIQKDASSTSIHMFVFQL